MPILGQYYLGYYSDDCVKHIDSCCSIINSMCLNQNVKDETASTVEQLREAESEAKALRTMTQRMILTHEEMVVL